MQKPAQFLCIVPHFWGKGDTVQDAVLECARQSYGTLSKPEGSKAALFTATKSTRVDDIGNILWNKDDGDPVELGLWQIRVTYDLKKITKMIPTKEEKT